MAKLTVCRGLPGAGKSLWAIKEVENNLGKKIRVNRDLLRIMLNSDKFDGPNTEDHVVSARDLIISRALARGVDVISDDTNLDRKVVLALWAIAEHNGASFELKDFDVPQDVCVERDANRDASVGEKVIAGMVKRHFNKGKFPLDPTSVLTGLKQEPYVPDIGLPRAAIVDIDGTIALHNRSPYDYSKVSTDTPNFVITDVVEALYAAGYWIIFLSGRPDSCERETRDWLDRHVAIGGYDLFMRKAGDGRNDAIIKYEIFDAKIRREFNVKLCIDDRQRVINMWRKIGLTVLDVAGNTF